MGDARAIAVLVALAAVGGCVGTLGISDYQRLDCVDGVGSCDASVDVQAAPEDAGPDGITSYGDGETPFDATGGGDGGGGSDTGTTSDTGPSPDTGAGSDAACAPACDTTNSNGGVCVNGACAYASCKPNHADCNDTAPDTNGCECATPGCCPGMLCQNTHANGTGQSYYDCVAVDTYNQTQATAACVAYTGNAALCAATSCAGPGQNVVVCSNGGTLCHCWGYGGTNTGHVHVGTSTACACPSGADPAWH